MKILEWEESRCNYQSVFFSKIQLHVRKNQILRYLRSIQHDISFSSILSTIFLENRVILNGSRIKFQNPFLFEQIIFEYWDKLDVAKYFLKVVTEAQDYMTLIFVWKFKKVAVP